MPRIALSKLAFQREVDLPVTYEGMQLDCGYRMDLIVSNRVVVELRAVEQLLPIHKAQLLTYMKLSGLRKGLLINFHEQLLSKGVTRMVL